MARSTQPLVRETFETALTVIRQASVEILVLLGVNVAEGKDPQWFLQQLDQARLNLGNWATVARRLNLNDAGMSQFTLQLRHLQQLVPQYESGQDVTENQLLAALRFVTCLEKVRNQQPKLGYSTDMDVNKDAKQGEALRQLRALDLTLRGMVRETWPDEQQRVNELKQLCGGDKVRRWLKMGDKGDVLSGMLFSELAMLVVDKKLFARHYDRLFQGATSLTLFVEPRKTLQTLLDDIRDIRNTATLGKPLSGAQEVMLDNYFNAISAPLHKACGEGRTRVNPAALMKADDAQLKTFFDHAAKKNSVVGGDIFDVRDAIESPSRRQDGKKQETRQLVMGAVWGAVGLGAIALVVGGLFIASDSVNPPAAERNTTMPVATAMAAEPENSDDSPRHKLSNMGITWDQENLRTAIDRDDAVVTRLFLEAGMNWKVAWTEQALAKNHEATLETLLRYRLQMDELKPCRRMITTLSHALSQGEKMTSMRKQYLQAFCTVPVVVQRQKYELEQAQLRAQANPGEETKKWVKIREAIYQTIR
ncbi:STY4199 family HEPN domain-containing protein [Cronobacter dublinensis]